MKVFISFLSFYCFLLLNKEASAVGENDVKKGQYPFMAFLYYPDDAIKDQRGARFFQNAILIKPDWLISASVDMGNNNYPIKTLIARTGVVNIDANFTFNEEEDEQEREIIRVVKPYNYNKEQIWLTDISLLQTLLPFNETLAVNPIQILPPYKYDEKVCNILIFIRKQREVEDKTLIHVAIEMLPSSVKTCGENFQKDIMTCGEGSENYHNITANTDMCQDNAGGPLICGGKVVGLQTYVEGKPCIPPHLYHLITGWKKFISCVTEYNCREDICPETCKSFPKDPATITPNILFTEVTPVKLLSADVTTKITTISSSVVPTVQQQVIKSMTTKRYTVHDIKETVANITDITKPTLTSDSSKKATKKIALTETMISQHVTTDKDTSETQREIRVDAQQAQSANNSALRCYLSYHIPLVPLILNVLLINY